MATAKTDISSLFPVEPMGMTSNGCPTLATLSPTPVFSAFWRFAAERHAIFTRRISQPQPPWTDDPILSAFKFTNAYRACDRVSQYLIRRVIYEGEQTEEEVVFRIILFKLFNKIETWQLLKRDLGEIRWSSFSVEQYAKVLSRVFDRGHPIYSAAYIMPSGSGKFRAERKHSAHLQLLKYMMDDRLPAKVSSCKSMHSLFDLLRSYPMLGDFLAYQYAIDLNYSTLVNFAESDFVMAGPGARNGIRKCFARPGSLTETDIIKLVSETQEREFLRAGINFQYLGGSRRLQLIDVQNLFCEIDKYARARFPEHNGNSGRTRIKQRFRPINSPINYWFPPKWGINYIIQAAS